MTQVPTTQRSDIHPLDQPRYGFGTGALVWDRPDSDTEAQKMVRQAITRGMHWIDTSPMYGFGHAESRIGHVLGGLDRSTYLLSTKTGYVMTAETAAAMKTSDPRVKRYPPRDYSAEYTRRSVEQSLVNLGTQRLDVIFIHDPSVTDVEAIRRGASPVLQRFKQQGIVGRVGIGLSSVDDALVLMDALEIEVIMIAGQHTLLVQEAGPLLHRCGEAGVEVFLAGPLNSGILADPYHPAPRFAYRPASQCWIEKARRVAEICQEFGVSLKAAALQYPLRDDRIRMVMTGPATIVELAETTILADSTITPDFWEALQISGIYS